MQQVPESTSADLGDRYLMALLECVRGWLQVRFDSQAAHFDRGRAGLAGLASFPDELARAFVSGCYGATELARSSVTRGCVSQATAEIVLQADREGSLLFLPNLVTRCSLSDIELDLIALLAAPEIDPAFLRAYANLWDDFGRKSVDLAFAAELLGADLRDRKRLIQALAADSPLLAHRLLDVAPSEEGEGYGPLYRPLKLAPSFIRLLLGNGRAPLDPLLAHHAELIDHSDLATSGRDDATRPGNQPLELEMALERAVASHGRLTLVGPAGSGRVGALCERLAETSGGVICLTRGGPHDRTQTRRRIELAFLEASLRDVPLLVDLDTVLPPVGDHSIERELLAETLCHLSAQFAPFLGLVATEDPVELRRSLGSQMLRMPQINNVERAAAWRNAIPPRVTLASDVDFVSLASQYRLGPTAVARGARAALSGLRPGRQLSQRDLLCAARDECAMSLSAGAERLEVRLGWDDVVLAPDLRAALDELRLHARRRTDVFRDCGFDVTIPHGRGVSALFDGPPGTGKTLVATILAKDLGLELHRIDLSRVLSKWVGETEQNLARVFDSAERNGALLLFDEADALFSARTAVRSANDRYGNLEVDYLLQRMESFDGVSILTTNRGTSIDEAFKRRLRFRLRFSVPAERERTELWRRMFPLESKLDPAINWARLAAEFEISGGYIRNAAVRAAFRAADRNDVVRFDDLRTAALSECQEIGKLVKS